MFTDFSRPIKSRIRNLFGRINPHGPPLFWYVPKAIAPYAKIEGFLSPREATALFYFASQVNSCATIVEVGSWKGKSTYCLAKGLRNGKVFAIDPFDASGDPLSAEIYRKQKGENDLLVQFKERMSELKVLENIEILHGLSADFRDRFKHIDLLFIDGDHSINGCKGDFDYFAHTIVPGGYILFHDYDPEDEERGSTWIVKNMIANDSEFKHIYLVDSLWIGQKR